MSRFKCLVVFISFLCVTPLFSKEGMWLPLLLEKNVYADMQLHGLQLTLEEVYSIDQSSLKDVVVSWNYGSCTGVVISKQGLVLTNYHCALDYIQAHSSLENDLLKNGFWALNTKEELPNKDLTVSFLTNIEDVTTKILENISDSLSETERYVLIDENIQNIQNRIIDSTDYDAVVKSFNFGNEYYLFVYKVYKDIRLVGAPPQSIGSYGGDTDNWIWPRHGGDFAVFRIYADTCNQPAEYAEENIPYRPETCISVSLKGINNGDFTMVFGYPGSTHQHVTSHHIDYLLNHSLPAKIHIRNLVLNNIGRAMRADDEVRIKYTVKQAMVSNAWKKWKGIIKGLQHMNVLEQKREFENQFRKWTASDSAANIKYGQIFGEFDSVYTDYNHYNLMYEYFWETISKTELISYVMNYGYLYNLSPEDFLEGRENELINQLWTETDAFYKDYHQPVDRHIFAELLENYKTSVPEQFYPAFFGCLSKKYKGDFTRFAEYVYEKSIFTKSSKVYNLLQKLDHKTINKIQSDPAFTVFSDFGDLYYKKIKPKRDSLKGILDSLYRIYYQGLTEMHPERNFYPDANSTLRITYGKVEGYAPADAVTYDYCSTFKGMIEKEGMHYDYEIPEKLKAIYVNKNYGDYTDKDYMPLCFVASNHTSGGNSGSPVINARGELIGLNFDRNWEGTMSDYFYNADICRNIAVDIRYILMLIDKYGGAGHLINEMNIVK